MDHAGDCEKKTRAQRKRKAAALLESDDDLKADDPHTPPEDFEDDTSDELYIPPKCFEPISSDDSDSDSKNNIKKLKTGLVDTIDESEDRSRCKGRFPLKRSRFRRKHIKHKKSHLLREKKEIEKSVEIPVLRKRCQKPSAGANSIIGYWYIASGFTKDLTALFKAFNELDSWRFSAFASCWQKLKFSLIYRGRESFKELLEFTEEICFWTKKFTSPIHDSKWRVGALYTLYSLYHKHPLKHTYKIRLEVDEYEHLENLARSFQNSAENPDPAYIFYKLKADGVLYYVATADEMGHTFYSSERQQDVMNYEVQWVLREHSANTIFPEQDRNIQKMLMEEYENVKSQLWGSGSGSEPEPDRGMSYLQPGIMFEVDAILGGLQGRHDPVLQEDGQDAPRPTHSQPEDQNIGQKRESIRERAATLSTTDNFFRRKLLRSPRKNPVAASPSQERSAESFSGHETVKEDHFSVPDNDKIMTFREIMEGMEPSSKEIPNKSLKSKKFRMETPSEDPQEHAYASTSSYSANEDLQDILLPNESCEQKYDNCLSSNKAAKRRHPKHKEKINSTEENVESGSSGSCSSLQKVVQQRKKVGPKKTPNKKTRKSLSQKETERSKTFELRNFRPKATEQPQALENTDTPKEGNELENILMERVLRTSVSENRTEESSTCLEVTATSEDIFRRSKNRSSPNKKRRGKPSKNRLRKRIPRFKPPDNDGEMRVSMIVKQKKNIPCEGKVTDEMAIWKQKEIEIEMETEENCSDQSSTQIYFPPVMREIDNQGNSFSILCNGIEESDHSRETAEKNITAADKVCEDDQAVVAETVSEVHKGIAVCKAENAESVLPSEDICEEVSHQANSGSLLSDNSNCESILPAVSNKQAVSEECLPQENCDNINPPQNVITVRVAARMFKNEHQAKNERQQASDVMFFLHINFEVVDVMIHSRNLKISKENLEAIYNDEKKLQRFRKKMYSFLPPEYQNYDMLLEIVIHDVVFDGGETSLFESPEQNAQWSPEREHPEQDPLAGDVPKLLNGAEFVCTEDRSIIVSHEVTSGSSFSDQVKHESIPHRGGKKQAVSNSDLQKTCDMNVVENVINVEISARMPRKKHRQSTLKGECMAILQIDFYLKNVMIHSTKFKMDKKDLEVIHNDKTKLEKMKKKFHSFLPPKYKNYELLLQLTIHDIVF